MARIWVASDHHFGHENIIKYCNRPFANAKEMDEALIDLHNSVVKPQDHFWCLGDVAMKKAGLHNVQRLNGHKRLTPGNHDIFDVEDYLKAGFQKITAMRVIDRILLSHVPIHPASMGRFRAHVHGHIHNSQTDDFGWPYINVSVEVINYTPVEFDQIVELIKDHERINEAVDRIRCSLSQDRTDPVGGQGLV